VSAPPNGGGPALPATPENVQREARRGVAMLLGGDDPDARVPLIINGRGAMWGRPPTSEEVAVDPHAAMVFEPVAVDVEWALAYWARAFRSGVHAALCPEEPRDPDAVKREIEAIARAIATSQNVPCFPREGDDNDGEFLLAVATLAHELGARPREDGGR
jgi:hypothetical protein